MLITLQKYLLREWLFAFAAVAIVLILVVVGVFAGDLLGDVASGSLPPGLLGSQLLFRLPEAVSMILPLALFIGIMLGLGRLYRDQEMAVMRSTGFHWHRMLKPLYVLALPVAGLLLLTTFLWGPGAAERADEELEEAFRSAALWGLKPGQFHSLQGGDLVVYVEQMDEANNALTEVFIYQREPAVETDGGTDMQDNEQVWTAEAGRYWVDPESGTRYLSLLNGQVSTTPPEGGAGMQLARFDRADLRLPDNRDRDAAPDPARMGLVELWQQPAGQRSAELHWRLSPALAVLLLGLLAIPLAHTDPRENRYGRLVIGLLVYAIYANLLTLGRVWLEEGALPPPSGLWWVHLMLLVTVLLWLRRQGRQLRL